MDYQTVCQFHEFSPVCRTTYYVSTTGSAGGTGAIDSPWSLAYALGGAGGTITAGSTISLRGGVYRTAASYAFGPAGSSSTALVTYQAYPGERPIITTTTDKPPGITMGDYMRLDGLWIGGTKAVADNGGIQTGASPISHWKQIVNCTIFGYYGAINSGSSEYLLIQGNRFVHNGTGELYHAVYINANDTLPPPAGTFTQHTIVDNNIFIAGAGDGGYAVHFFHNNRTGIASRNFMTGSYGIVMDGADELATNNFLWKSANNGTPTSEALDWLYIVTRGYARNNILGPSDALMNPETGGNTNIVTTNAYESATNAGYNKGLNPITITSGSEATQIGISATTLDSAIAALKTSFSASINTILADSTIETNFAVISGITVPGASPLYHTGVPWYDANAINVGPNSGAPTTVAGFWAAFRALGLNEWDSNANITP